MTKNDKAREEDHVGPAYQARYVRLGRVRFDTPMRRALLIFGILILVGLIPLALIAS